MNVQPDRFLPAEIILEVTNACNLHCVQCHFHGHKVKRHRAIGHMKRHLWEKALHEIQSWKHPVTLLTHGAGEPLLYPDLIDLLHAAKNIPHVSTGFMTNGMLLDEEWSSALVSLQVDWVAFSIDGIDPMTHDYYRKGADLRTIEKNVQQLVHEKKVKNSPYPRLFFNMVGYPEILDQSDAYIEKWLPSAERITIAKFRPVGSRKLWPDGLQVTFRPCPLLSRQMVISWDGRIGLCCEDIHLEVPLGNLADTSLENIFNFSPQLLNYRNRHASGDIDDLPLCLACHIWGGDRVLQKNHIAIGNHLVEKVQTPAYDAFQKVPES